MRPRRPVVHHGAVALSSGSRYQARPALQSIPPVPAKRRAITSASRAGIDVMVPHDWIWLASTQPVQSCPLPPLCLLWQFVAGLRVASVRSSEGSPATIFNP